MSIIKKIGYIFNRTQKLKLFIIFIMITIGSFFELIGVAAVIPFIDIAVSPEAIFKNKILYTVYSMLKFQDAKAFLVAIALFLVAIYIIKNSYLIFMNSIVYRFTFNNQKKLSCRLLECYTKQPYIFFLNHNTADLIRNVGQDTDNFFEAVSEFLKLMMEVIVCSLLCCYLLLTDLTITIFLVLVLACAGGIILKSVKKNLQKQGILKRDAHGGRNKWVLQTFGGIKEIKVLEKEPFFLKQYEKQYKIYAEAQKKYRILAYIPRPIMETLCVGGLLLIVAIKLINGTDPAYFVSTMSVFAVSAFRLLPSFNRMSESASRIMFNKSSIDAVYQDLRLIEHVSENDNYIKNDKQKMEFNKSIKVEDLYYKYPDADQYVLENARLEIPKNKSVAFVGASGAGKTTLADILLGILKPDKGNVFVDDADIYSNLHAWHNLLGYIPQTIFLMDDTIRNNIVLGVPEDEINEARVQEVLEEAQLKQFVSALPEGLDTVIGEGGVRLSGGQRQRIGIARALYRNPEVLVLDEATSALDHDTESAVMEAINHLAGSKTLIIIAHRLSTIEKCDIVFEVKNRGIVINRGRVEESNEQKFMETNTY